jgi:hypothetical protein
MNKNLYFFIVFAVIIGIPAVNASTQLIDVSDEIGDANHSAIDIVRVTISKDSDIYTSQITVNGNIDTNTGQYSIKLYNGPIDRYMIGVFYNFNGIGIWENQSVPGNTSMWGYFKIRDIQASANGNTLNIVADFGGIDITGYTIRKAGAYLYAPDNVTLLDKDTVNLTSTPTPTATATPTPTPSPTATATPTPTRDINYFPIQIYPPSPTATATPTPTPSPTTDYDTNHDGHISKSEAITAVVDFFSGLISKQQAISVVMQYFRG